jgi:hypothetical protein
MSTLRASIDLCCSQICVVAALISHEHNAVSGCNDMTETCQTVPLLLLPFPPGPRPSPDCVPPVAPGVDRQGLRGATRVRAASQGTHAQGLLNGLMYSSMGREDYGQIGGANAPCCDGDSVSYGSCCCSMVLTAGVLYSANIQMCRSHAP